MIVARVIAGAVGLGIFAAMTDAAVEHAGGYNTLEARLLMALGVGAAAAALLSGVAWRDGARGLAVLMLVGAIVAEAGNLQRTAERLAISREAQQAPARNAAERRAVLARHLKRARERVTEAERPTARLTAAIEREQQVAVTVAEKSAERGCASNCRKLLQAQVDAAAVEIQAARSEQDERVAAARANLKVAEAALAAVKIPPAPSALARWLDLPARYLDLGYAGAMSFAMLTLGLAMLHYAGRPGSGRDKDVTQTEAVGADARVTRLAGAEPANDVTRHKRPQKLLPPPDPRAALEEIDAWAVATIKPAGSRSKVTIGDMRAAYLVWCEHEGRQAVCEQFFHRAMPKMARDAGLDVGRGLNPSVAGVRLETFGNRVDRGAA
jgi:hypothetical protein